MVVAKAVTHLMVIAPPMLATNKKGSLMTHYTYQDIYAMRLGACTDVYISNIESLVPCTVCDSPVISIAANGYATQHANH